MPACIPRAEQDECRTISCRCRVKKSLIHDVGPDREEKAIARFGGRRYIVSMTTVQEIERAIEKLPGDEFSTIRDWIVEKDWEKWDAQIERDSEAGKLDFLAEEALRDAESGNTRPL